MCHTALHLKSIPDSNMGTGQISGFTTMDDFLVRFGQHDASGYYFSNVRQGLIVGLVSLILCKFSCISSALYSYPISCLSVP